MRRPFSAAVILAAAAAAAGCSWSDRGGGSGPRADAAERTSTRTPRRSTAACVREWNEASNGARRRRAARRLAPAGLPRVNVQTGITSLGPVIACRFVFFNARRYFAFNGRWVGRRFVWNDRRTGGGVWPGGRSPAGENAVLLRAGHLRLAVPRVLGMRRGDAEALLTAMGIDWCWTGAATLDDRVRAQASPRPGDALPPGARIALVPLSSATAVLPGELRPAETVATRLCR